MKVLVQVGSNLMNISVSKETKCQDLINKSLTQSGIIKNSSSFLFNSPKQFNESSIKMYSMFEIANGIERMIDLNQNIYEILMKLKTQQIKDLIFAVKLCKKSKTLQNKIRISRKNSKFYAEGRHKSKEGSIKPNEQCIQIDTRSENANCLIKNKFRPSMKLLAVIKSLTRKKSSASSQNSAQVLIK